MTSVSNQPHQLNALIALNIGDEIRLRQPSPLDGASVHALIARCVPLDTNSLYCNLLQCSMFTQTCVVAELDAQIVGFVSALVPPAQPDTLFVWQVAVAPEARGKGLAGRMLQALLARLAGSPVTQLQTTITSKNLPSWALFGSLAKSLDTNLNSRVLFDRQQHLDNRHDTEMLVTIGRFAPFAAATQPR